MSAASLRLTVQYQSIDKLKCGPRNARLHSDDQIKKIARSIKAFGFVVPALIDRHAHIVAGEGRVRAARVLGLSDVPVIQLEHLTESQLKAFQIADNRLAEMATWNDQLLAEALKDLCNTVDFDVELTGFSIPEIDLRIEGLSTSNDPPDVEDQIPKSDNLPAVSKLGDMWRLGCHSVLCGNALAGDSYHILLGGERAHLVFTDPPFNVAIEGHVSGRGRVKHRDFSMAVGELTQAEFTLFLKTCCALMASHSVDGSIHYLCMDWRHIGELLAAGNAAYTELKNICVWVKDNGGMGSLYRSRHELIFVFKQGTTPHRNNVQLGRFHRNRTNVWEYPCANTFSRQSEEGNLSALHPTVKPVAMVADAILDCSARGNIVLDPFLGSGTTLIASERVGRVCRGIEIDPLYVDTVIRRWQAYTGEQALHGVTGAVFDDLAKMEQNRVSR